jgi:2-(1,2-epoxy-1,2-dihydrophenyl)acetyl-CoA isomerase
MSNRASGYEHITYEMKGSVGLITLNRPERLNAWTPLMEEEFIDAVESASLDRDVGTLVVTGAGRAFCSGADISGMPIALSRGKPIIAAINGPAVGVGLTMSLACDIRIASDQARLSARFVKVGLTPECGSTRYLAQVAGLGNALVLALTGRIIDASEAKDRGLVDRVVAHEDLMKEAMALAEEISSNPADAVWAAKRLIHENASESDLRRVVSTEGLFIREMRRHPDHSEAVQAFLEKREPRFGR